MSAASKAFEDAARARRCRSCLRTQPFPETHTRLSVETSGISWHSGVCARDSEVLEYDSPKTLLCVKSGTTLANRAPSRWRVCRPRRAARAARTRPSSQSPARPRAPANSRKFQQSVSKVADSMTGRRRAPRTAVASRRSPPRPGLRHRASSIRRECLFGEGRGRSPKVPICAFPSSHTIKGLEFIVSSSDLATTESLLERERATGHVRVRLSSQYRLQARNSSKTHSQDSIQHSPNRDTQVGETRKETRDNSPTSLSLSLSLSLSPRPNAREPTRSRKCARARVCLQAPLDRRWSPASRGARLFSRVEARDGFLRSNAPV